MIYIYTYILGKDGRVIGRLSISIDIYSAKVDAWSADDLYLYIYTRKGWTSDRQMIYIYIYSAKVDEWSADDLIVVACHTVNQLCSLIKLIITINNTKIFQIHSIIAYLCSHGALPSLHSKNKLIFASPYKKFLSILLTWILGVVSKQLGRVGDSTTSVN